jgi:hypothetical protein
MPGGVSALPDQDECPLSGRFPTQREGRRLGKDGLMPLSLEEQRVLDSIEDGLRVNDPVLRS